ncbi:MAG: hypothetical protein J6C78_07965 [Muribaculaceae bacterium]|nr:hypothetical protein [Muribaculaceae bacterium]
MGNRLIFSLVAALMLIPAQLSASDDDCNRISLNGTLTSSDSYSLDVAYHYMICRYVGIGGSFGYWSNYYEDGWASGRNWNIDDDDNKPSNYYLRPSMIFKSPGVRCRDTYWSIYVEPGLMLNVPYQRVCIESFPNWHETQYHYISTTKGQWFATDLRIGICLNCGPFGLSAGYMVSNLDIYSQYRHLSYRGVSFKNFYPEKPVMRGAYLSLFCKF